MKRRGGGLRRDKGGGSGMFWKYLERLCSRSKHMLCTRAGRVPSLPEVRVSGDDVSVSRTLIVELHTTGRLSRRFS